VKLEQLHSNENWYSVIIAQVDFVLVVSVCK